MKLEKKSTTRKTQNKMEKKKIYLKENVRRQLQNFCFTINCSGYNVKEKSEKQEKQNEEPNVEERIL